MNINANKPSQFFAITYLVSYVFWGIAAIVSSQPGGDAVFISFLIPGMIAPFGAALWMLYRSESSELWKSFKERIFNVRLFNAINFFPALLIIPVAILIAAWISILTGGDPAQLQWAEGFSFSIGMAPSLLVLILAATFEELGWRGYGVDSLNAHHNYFKTTLLFSALWAFWHLPLFLITGTYQHEIASQSLWYAVNFFVGIVPMAFIINWVYRSNHNSITAAILFHFFTNLSQEALNITQSTKCIETFVLVIIAVIIVLLNRSMFFDTPNRNSQVIK